ncbi:MAG: Crp/Fnr family transcriptional regulator [Bacteroidetes bacterium]|nr:Crp/Fnr family transcriptional regulator [Bacteroidota bacterium]
MDALEQIAQYVKRHIPLTAEEEQYFTSLLRVTRVKKKQLIVQPEFVCKYRSYVYSGAMRAYLLDHHAQEHTIAIAIEDWWISDYNSYIFQQPATLFVEALEDSILIQIDYNAEQLLMETIPKFERFFRIITQRSFAFLQRRLLSSLSKTAEERYEEFLQKYPAIVQRVPQYALASYLGMSNVYLSQLRNNRTTKKS